MYRTLTVQQKNKSDLKNGQRIDQREVGLVEGKRVLRQVAEEARDMFWLGEGVYVAGNTFARDDRRKLWRVTGDEF